MLPRPRSTLSGAVASAATTVEAVAVAEQGGELLATIDGLLAKRLGCKAKGRCTPCPDPDH